MSNVGTGQVNAYPNAAYAASFGNTPDRTEYANAYKSVDMREDFLKQYKSLSAEQKALSPSTGGSGTAGNAMVPVYLDPRIVDISRKETPLVEMIPRVTNLGLTADYNRVTAKGSAFTANADAALNESDDTYERQSKSIKYLYAVGRVLGPAQASYPSYLIQGMQPSGSGLGGTPFGNANAANAMQLEVLMKARQLKEKEEDLILNGNSGNDATEFDGIIQQQGSTNVTDQSSANITLDDIEAAVLAAFKDGGRPKIAVCSPSVLKKIRSLLIADYNYRPADMGGGDFQALVPSNIVLETIVGQIPVFPSRFLDDTDGSQSIWFLDTDFIEMRVLQDMTYEELAKTNDSEKFMLKIYECLVVKAPEFNAAIDNIDVTA